MTLNELLGYVILGGLALYGVISYIMARRRDPDFRLGKAILMSLAGMIAEDCMNNEAEE